MDLPITDHVPFTGLESEPKSHEIAALIHLGNSEVEAHMTTKGGLEDYQLSSYWRKLTILLG